MERFIRRTVISVGCALMLPSAAPAISRKELSAFNDAATASDAGLYLKSANILCATAFDRRLTVRSDMAFQLWNQQQVAITGIPYIRPGISSKPRLEEARPANLVASDALQEIRHLASKTRVVILNEDHIHPDQRSFALEVARLLRPLGYNVLALEALNNTGNASYRMAALKSRGYVVRNDGVYLREPTFAEFVRQALAIGYFPLSYDAFGDRSATVNISPNDYREDAQAKNIIKELSQDPHRRVFIYSGTSHLAERPLSEDGGTVRMATRLKRAMGIDPLTIDQTTLYRNCLWCQKLVSANTNRRVTFTSPSGPFVWGHLSGAVDMQVYRPLPPAFAVGSDLAVSENWVSAIIPNEFIPLKGIRLIQAFDARDGADGIPVAQTLLYPGGANLLFVPRRQTKFIIQESTSAHRHSRCEKILINVSKNSKR